MQERKLGAFSQEVIDVLNLNISAGTPIYIGESNVEHIKKRHIYEYEKYFDDIEEIVENPDYVGRNPHDNSILFVKLYEVNGEYIRVAERYHLLGNITLEHYIFSVHAMLKDTLKNKL